MNKRTATTIGLTALALGATLAGGIGFNCRPNTPHLPIYKQITPPTFQPCTDEQDRFNKSLRVGRALVFPEGMQNPQYAFVHISLLNPQDIDCRKEFCGIADFGGVDWGRADLIEKPLETRDIGKMVINGTLPLVMYASKEAVTQLEENSCLYRFVTENFINPIYLNRVQIVSPGSKEYDILTKGNLRELLSAEPEHYVYRPFPEPHFDLVLPDTHNLFMNRNDNESQGND